MIRILFLRLLVEHHGFQRGSSGEPGEGGDPTIGPLHSLRASAVLRSAPILFLLGFRICRCGREFGRPAARIRARCVNEISILRHSNLIRLRHEAADVAVMTDRKPGHNPVCDHRCPPKSCDRSHPTVRSSWDNETSPDPGGRGPRERTRRLPAPGRSGTRVDGMANSGELPINAVILTKPTALTGLNQTVRGQVQGLLFPLPSLSSRRRIGRA